jgi:uncharacterized protein YqeY
MTTKEQLQNALKDAMRSGDELRKRTLRMVISAIRLAEVEKQAELDEQSVIAILQKDVKSHQETIAEAKQANREDLVQTAQAEVAVLESFLPQPMPATDLEALARQAITETGANSPSDMGKVMKTLMPKVQGRATGEQVSQTVRRLLQGR